MMETIRKFRRSWSQGGHRLDKPAPIFGQIYKDYLRQIEQLDLRTLANKIGIEFQDDSILIPFFGQRYRVSARQITDPSGKEPIHAIKVVLGKYLLQYPPFEPAAKDWVSYKDFKGAAPFVDGFQNNTERAIARNFAGKLKELREASLGLCAKDPGLAWNYQLIMMFDPLPHLPLLLLFNDADEEFPSQCLILFEQRAQKYLDMECLAILAWLLSDYLHQSLRGPRTTIM